jgi:hypothetical protein
VPRLAHGLGRRGIGGGRRQQAPNRVPAEISLVVRNEDPRAFARDCFYAIGKFGHARRSYGVASISPGSLGIASWGAHLSPRALETQRARGWRSKIRGLIGGAASMARAKRAGFSEVARWDHTP